MADPIQFFEVPDSDSSTAIPPTVTKKYKCTGLFDRSAVEALALTATAIALASQYGILSRQDIKVDPDGYAQYWVTVPYGQKNREVGSYTFSFDTSGATVKRKQAIVHQKTYYASGFSGSDNPHGGAIGVNSTSGECEGADIVIPCLKLNVTFRHPAGQITIAKMKQLAGGTGKINSDTFLTFQAGEVLLLGSSGLEGTQSEADVTYVLAVNSNTTGATIGPFTGVDFKGWDYFWIEYVPAVGTGGGSPAPVTVPKALHVEKVYFDTAFQTLLGFGG
jgi:hypothetical protein